MASVHHLRADERAASAGSVSVGLLELGGAMMQAPVPMVVLDAALRVSDCNSAFAAMFGVPRQSLLGFDLAGLTGVGPYEALQRALTGVTTTWSGRYRSNLAGRDIFGTVRAGPIREADAIVGVSAVIELADATPSRVASQRSRIDNEMLDSRLGVSWFGTVDALWELDRATHTFSLSPRLREMLGYEPHLPDSVPESLRDFRALVHSDDRALLDELFSAHPGDVPLDVEIRVRDAEGAVRFFRLRARSICDEGGEVRKWIGSLGDVTAMHRARAAAREAEAMFRALAEQSVWGSYILDNGRLAFVNARFCEMFGYSMEELLALADIFGLVHPDDQPLVREHLRLREAGAQRSHYRVRGQRRDGSSFVLEVHGDSVAVEGKQMLVGMLLDVTERVESEQKVAEALAAADHDRRQLRATLEALPVGVWISDARGTLLTSNAAVTKLYGGVAPRVRKEKYDSYVAFWPDTGVRLEPDEWPLSRALRDGTPVVSERIDLQRPDGRRVPLLVSAAPIRDADNNITGGVIALLDISELREAERQREALIASLDFERKQLQAMFTAAPTILAALRGPDHVVALVNDALYDAIGRRDLLGKPLLDAVPELRNQGVLEALNRAYSSGEAVIEKELPLLLARRAEGAPQTRFLNLSYIPITDESGVRAGTLINGYDVTEQVDAEQALRTSDRRMRAQFRALPTPTKVFQAIEKDGARDFVLIDHSDAALKLTEGAIQLGMSAGSFLTEVVVENLWRSLEGRLPARHEIEFKVPSTGAARRLALTYCAAPPDIVILHCEDVTDRMQLEEQLRHSQKMEAIGQLAGGIAHDFNNLLAVISTCAEFLADGLAEADAMYEDVDEIRRAAARAGDLTRKLLTFSRRQVTQPRSINLDAIVSSTETMLRRVIGAPIHIELQLDGGPATVHADAGQIEQVILNLAVNARDAMAGGGVLTVATAIVELDDATAAARGVHPGVYVAISVTDTGSGISPSVLPRLFEPFFTTKEVGRGTGLGLPTVYGVAKQFGGYVVVDSVVGRGSTFEVGFPREVFATILPRADISGRILVVDDEPGVRALARRILERAGYEVVAVGSGKAALEHASTRFDLVLTDFVMPEMNGRQLHAELARRHPSLPVLYMSGYVDDEAVRRDENVSLLAKPFTAASLIEAVRTAMAK